jgi:glycosyltransferase involved in cell wall biosynthesis
MRRVLIFSLNYYPFVGGAEVAIKEITDRLSPEEYEFHLLAPRYDSQLTTEEKIGNVIVHRYGLSRKGSTISDQSKLPLKLNKYLYQLTAHWKAEQLHREHGFNTTWAMMAHATAIPAGRFKKRHPEIPYLLTLQEGDPPEYIEQLMKPVWKWFVQGFTKADYIQAISTFLLSWGRRMGFTGEGTVVPNAVDTKRFMTKPTPEKIQEIRTRFSITANDVVLVTTSRLVHKNAVDDVIRALPLTDSRVVFVVCGIGPDEEKLKALVTQLHLEDRVRFVGQVDHADLPAVLHSSNIFIRPSRSEGMGNSFIEAMAASVPVIATQEGGISDFLFDEKKNPDKRATGWAVSKDAPNEIAEAITDILTRPEKVAEVTTEALELVQKTYDWEIVAQDMDDIFKHITAKETGPATI